MDGDPGENEKKKLKVEPSGVTVALMRRRRGSTRGYAHSEDLETGVRRSEATDRRADGVTTRALQPPLQLIPSF